MPELVPVETAKTAIAELLDFLGIEKILCVDDYYAPKWAIDDILDGQRKLNPQQLTAVLPHLGVIPDDEDVRREMVRRLWERADSTEQAGLGDKIMALVHPSPAATEDDIKAASRLQELLGENRLTKLAPVDWERNEAQVLEAAARSCTLVLFDQDLSRAGGSATGGMTLLKNALAKDSSGKLICGLLTHTASKVNQQEQWERYASENGVEKYQFVLVAKQWLNDDPQGFVRMLKLVALSPDCIRMKDAAQAILDEVNKEAAKSIEKLSVFDFERIVFQASHSEGIWEADMLFRLHAIFQRPALRQKAHNHNELNETIGRLRKVSLIPSDPEETGTPEQTSWDLQQQEMYETDEYINSLHLPIEVGDIFEKTGSESKKAFILLGQPCDLMVRSKGERMPEISDVLLAEIVSQNPAQQELPPNTDAIEYYGDNRQAQYYVKFRYTHFVDPCVLDLCVFHADGTSWMDLATACPSNMLPGWTRRFEVLRKRTAALLERYKTLAGNKAKDKVTEEMLQAAKLFPPMIGNSRVFKASVDFKEGGGRVLFNCRRVKRLCRPQALALTLKYTSCFTRPAFDRDLGR
jgi:hypothetical protein